VAPAGYNLTAFTNPLFPVISLPPHDTLSSLGHHRERERERERERNHHHPLKP
jgi:hypothetical protein